MTTTLLEGDCLEVLTTLPDCSVQCVVTSPPYYGLRDYGVEGQIGLEATPEAYVEKLVAVFREVHRVLKDDGTVWLNLGDNLWNGKDLYSDSRCSTVCGKHNVIKRKDLIGIPWMVAFALRERGWYLRSDVIWSKPNVIPENISDRPTRAHEYIFLLSKNNKYYYDSKAVKENSTEQPSGNKSRKDNHQENRSHFGINIPYTPDGTGRNRRDVWEIKQEIRPDWYWQAFWEFSEIYMGEESFADLVAAFNNEAMNTNEPDVWRITTKPFPGAHFATFPPDLIEPCILAGSRVGDTVLDPFNGSGTTGQVAIKWHRNYIGIELNPEYIELTRRRLAAVQVVLI